MSSANAMHDAEQGKPRRRKCIDETGKVYGRLTVVEYAPGHEGQGAMWRVRCRCGRERLARGFLLRAGLIKSCGCLLPRGDRRRETTPLHTDPVLELMRERDELRARLVDAVQERNAARTDWEACALNLAEVTRERDLSLACWEAAGMQGRSAHSAMLELAQQLADATNEATRVRLEAKREIEALTDELLVRVRELEEEREQIRARLEEECERTRGLEHERDGLAIALEATETMLVAWLDRAERVILDGQEWVERNRGTVNMTQRAKKSKTFETNAFTRAPMTLVDYGLSMWVCAVCDKCAVFNRQAGKPNGWRADRCPECQGAEE